MNILFLNGGTTPWNFIQIHRGLRRRRPHKRSLKLPFYILDRLPLPRRRLRHLECSLPYCWLHKGHFFLSLRGQLQTLRNSYQVLLLLQLWFHHACLLYTHGLHLLHLLTEFRKHWIIPRCLRHHLHRLGNKRFHAGFGSRFCVQNVVDFLFAFGHATPLYNHQKFIN